MGKTKLMLDVVEQMRSLADSVEVLAQGMVDGGSRPKPVLEKKQDKPAVTHEMLRELAVELTRSGRRADIKTLLESYDVKNITAVAETDLESFYADLLCIKEVYTDAAK